MYDEGNNIKDAYVTLKETKNNSETWLHQFQSLWRFVRVRISSREHLTSGHTSAVKSKI